MKNTAYILNILIMLVSSIYSQDMMNVAWFNFHHKDIDERNELIVDFSQQISDKFINIIKNDIMFIDNVNFISTKDLHKELKQTDEKIINAIIPSFKENFSGEINENILVEKISAISDRLTLGQINSLVDSMIIYIKQETKDLTIDMMDINGGLSSTEINVLHDLVDKKTNETLKKHILSSLVASSREDFQTDIIVTGKYSIIENEINVNLYLYNYDDFSLIDTIHSKSFINKIHILIKDLEFKLLTRLGIDLNETQKETLCKYDLDNFSKKYYSLYFSNIFESNDFKEIAYRLQIDNEYDFLNNHYKIFFTGLVNQKIRYMIKLYDDDNYYNVFSTISTNDYSVSIDVLRSNWYNEVGKISAMESPNSFNNGIEKSQTIIDINYDNIESIYFYKGNDNLIQLLKQIGIYSSVIGLVFLLNLLI